MTLYELYKYKENEIIEIEYLLEQSKRFDIQDNVQEAFFQFPPSLIKENIQGFGEHEPWAVSHKRLIIGELVYILISKTSDNEYDEEYWSNMQIEKEIFTPFILKTDFRKLSDEELYQKFKEFRISIEKNSEKE